MKRSNGLSAGLTKARRKAVYRRDGFACVLCGRADGLQIHHVTPKSQGGPDESWNLVTLCPMCHQLAHGERPVYEGYEYLRDFGWTPEDVKQEIIEYLADYYVDIGQVWTEEGLVNFEDVNEVLFKQNPDLPPEGDPAADDEPPIAFLGWEEPGPGPEVKPLEREW